MPIWGLTALVAISILFGYALGLSDNSLWYRMDIKLVPDNCKNHD